jgi:hypothetical protein
MSNENIIGYIIEYKQTVKEIDALKNEIKILRQRLKPRFLELEKSKTKYETEILKYLEHTNDPGIKYQDTILFKDLKKKIPGKQERSIKLEELTTKYNLSEDVLNDISDIFKRKKTIQNEEYTIKIKNVNEKKE